MTIGSYSHPPRWREALGPADYEGASRAFRARLKSALCNPVAPVSVEKLAALFTLDLVEVEATLPSGLEDHPDLPIRLRGALGRHLATMPPPVDWRYDPHGRARAFDILYQPLGQIDHRTAIPKPMTVHADILGRTLRVRIVLIGAGGYWWPDVAAALQSAFDHGISLHNMGRQKIPIAIKTLRHHRLDGIDAEDQASSTTLVKLQLLSPLRLRSGQATRFDAASLLISIVNRVAALARWQYLSLESNWSALHDATHHVALFDADLNIVRWERGSIRQAARIPVLGLTGSCSLSGDLAPFVPYFAIAQQVNFGSHASLGFGRARIIRCP